MVGFGILEYEVGSVVVIMRLFCFTIGALLLSVISFQVQSQNLIKKQHFAAHPVKCYPVFIPQSKKEVWLSIITEQKFRCSFLTLSNLAKAAKSVDDNKPFDCLYTHLVYLQQELNIREKLFEQLAGKGSIAFVLCSPPMQHDAFNIY
jgi:hypothetical protein